MADRLGESNNALIPSKNTKKSTNNWLKLGRSWASSNGYDNSTETYYLGVYATVRKERRGLNYERNSLCVLVTIIELILNEKECKHLFIRERRFKSLKKILAGKPRRLQQQHEGKRPHQ